jgi:hypothetical protein
MWFADARVPSFCTCPTQWQSNGIVCGTTGLHRWIQVQLVSLCTDVCSCLWLFVSCCLQVPVEWQPAQRLLNSSVTVLYSSHVSHPGHRPASGAHQGRDRAHTQAGDSGLLASRRVQPAAFPAAGPSSQAGSRQTDAHICTNSEAASCSLSLSHTRTHTHTHTQHSTEQNSTAQGQPAVYASCIRTHRSGLLCYVVWYTRCRLAWTQPMRGQVSKSLWMCWECSSRV